MTFHNLCQKYYYDCRRILETHIIGTRMQEWIWKTRHIYKGSSWTKNYWETISHPHRPLLVEAVSSFAPIKSILEVGCNVGTNLYLLSKKLPDTDLYGIDINDRAIEDGKTFLAQEGVKNVSLYKTKADELGQFADKSIDLTFTDAVLIFIGPDKIQKVLKELIRITSKAIVFNEWNCPDTAKCPFWCDGRWIYDYNTLLKSYVSLDNITISKLPKGVWGGCWGEYGAIIKVKL